MGRGVPGERRAAGSEQCHEMQSRGGVKGTSGANKMGWGRVKGALDAR